MAGILYRIIMMLPTKTCQKQLLVLMALMMTFGPLSMDATEQNVNDFEGVLKLKTDAPAVLDAPITITATLENVGDFRPPFYFSFNDDASPIHVDEEETDLGTANYTLKYPSRDYSARQYTMTVRVYTKWIFGRRHEIAYDNVVYEITKQLNGQMDVNQKNRKIKEGKHGSIISTKEVTKVDIDLYDPHCFLCSPDTTMSYYWFINDTNYGSTNDTSFEYTFSDPGLSTVEVLVLAKIANPNNDRSLENNRKNTIYESSVRNSSSLKEISRLESPPFVKNGLFRKRLDARDPMANVNYSGDVYLKHGTMLDLTVTCDGSGPWNTCWYFRDVSYNKTGSEICQTVSVVAGKCEFPILWYFRNSGSTALIIVVDDGLNHIVKQVAVVVYDVPSRAPISLIVIPIMSSMIAVIACISGVFVFMTFKRNIRGRETADFDFACPTERCEELEYMTFWERLRTAALNALSNATAINDSASHVSSVSSHRSVQGPPVGIHYGSIS